MEEAFEWIEQGNQACDDKNYWKASHCFGQAFPLLHSFRTSQTEIQELCLTQSREYKQKARECFVQALQQGQSSSNDSVNDNDHFERLQLFAHLYSNPKLLDSKKSPTNATNTTTTTTTLDDLSLRLQALHEFQIPKQSLSKMEELNAGLCRLGLQPVTEEKKKPSSTIDVLGIECSQSPDEQVNALLQQVQEQVQVMTRSQDDDDAQKRNDSREDADDDDDDDDDDSMDEQRQVNRLLQQIQDEQALQGMEDETDEPETRSPSIQSEPSTVEHVTKDTLEAELLLTQVIGLLEDESLNTTTREKMVQVQTWIRQARSTLHRAEQHVAKIIVGNE